jgi:uncharacterized protein (UPF0297 family)
MPPPSLLVYSIKVLMTTAPNRFIKKKVETIMKNIKKRIQNVFLVLKSGIYSNSVELIVWIIISAQPAVVVIVKSVMNALTMLSKLNVRFTHKPPEL